MISKENIKYCIFISFISILIYKIIDNPIKFVYSINALIKFLSPFLLGLFFSLLINPLMMLFEKTIKSPRLLNILFSYMIVFILLIIGFKLIIPTIIDTLNTLISEMPRYVNMLDNYLNSHISSSVLLEAILPHIQNNLNSILKRLLDMFSKVSLDFVVYIFTITSVLFNIIMGIILSIYMLYDKENIGIYLKNILYAIISKPKADKILDFFKMSSKIFYHYIIGKIIDSLIISIIAFIGFKFILKIDNVLFLSFIIFLTNIIPYFGPLIGAIPPIIMTLVYSPIKALWVFIFIFILQQLDGNLIGPKIMGNQIGLGPLWIISSVLIGGALFGFIGLFLSVPLAAVIKISIDKFIDNKIKFKDSH